jgi:phosphate transport system permease protein
MSNFTSKIGKVYVLVSTLVATGIIFLILAVTCINSSKALFHPGFSLFKTEWNPFAGLFGILPMVYGTAAVTAIALVLAVPMGILCALFISEILPIKYRLVAKSFIELLAGIPSIIYGLIGIAVLCVWIGDVFHLSSGRTLLSAGILLAMMILPTIITLCEDAFLNVPSKYREAAYGLGLTKYEMIRTTILPIAKPDVVGAILLATGRALGETMAVLLVIGSLDKMPRPLYNVLVPSQTMTSKIGRELAESSYGSVHFSALIAMGLLLLIFVLFITFIAQFYFASGERLHE